MKTKNCLYYCLLSSVCCLSLLGCESPRPCLHHVSEAKVGPASDRPFPLGQVTDAHWDTQKTNAAASEFVFYDHEFVGDSAKLTPLGEKHLLQVALRIPHVPFPVVVEESVDNKNPKLDGERRMAIVTKLTRLGVCQIDRRVVISSAIAEGISAVEGEAAYYGTLTGGEGSIAGRGAGGFNGVRR